MHTSYLNLVLTRRQGENNKFGIYSNDKLQVDLIKWTLMFDLLSLPTTIILLLPQFYRYKSLCICCIWILCCLNIMMVVSIDVKTILPRWCTVMHSSAKQTPVLAKLGTFGPQVFRPLEKWVITNWVNKNISKNQLNLVKHIYKLAKNKNMFLFHPFSNPLPNKMTWLPRPGSGQWQKKDQGKNQQRRRQRTTQVPSKARSGLKVKQNGKWTNLTFP